MSRPIRHKEIFDDLREQIVGGRMKEGDRLPSESQLVRKYGVSRPTAARALRDLQTAGHVERRAGSGTYVRSRNPVEAPGRPLVGLMVPGMGITEIFDVICGKLIGLAHTHEYSVVWSSAPPPAPDADAAARAEDHCREMLERKVRGVFFAPHGWLPGQYEINRMIAARLRRAGVAVVLLDCDVEPFPNRSDFDLVGLDNFGAGYLATDHLLNMGCTRVRFIATSHTAPTINARYAGFREALLRHDLPVDRGPCPAIDPSDTEQVKALMKRRPDALVCANDYKAAVLMQTLESLGRRAPRDVRIVGFDDVKYATLLRVPLTHHAPALPRHRRRRLAHHAGPHCRPQPAALRRSALRATRDPPVLRRLCDGAGCARNGRRKMEDGKI